ncbi:RNA-binding protein RO60-like [Mercenaria mercenaria]|uniref:RNA-binding protein RO60-like n=1 Tax=Mercenaria mercenaria TaxID=6596 RepID=UPI00234EE5C0|nr:RNA-binding protein RO60-like [Mercenaria mercenaria]
MCRLQRFLVIGCDGGSYYATDHAIQNENVDFIKRLIDTGKGVDVVAKIKEISVSRRNMKQDPILLALAICARSHNRNTKSAAYDLLLDVCRTPTHLFTFVKFSEQESKEGTGWGNAHKRGVSKWYTMKDPERLARLVTKCKKRASWSHKDVIRLAHTKTTDVALGFILRYIAKGLHKAREMYILNASNVTPETAAKLDKLAVFIENFEQAGSCKNPQQLCSMIRQYKLTWEQCNSELLKNKDVWLALLPHMPIEATIRNLGRMTSYGMLAENSEDEQLVLDKIRSMNTVTDRTVSEDEDEGYGMNVGVQHAQGESLGNRRQVLHPFKILLALITYKTGHGDKGSRSWTPNQRIMEALDRAFYQAFERVEPTGKKYYLAVDVSGSMSQPVLGSSNISCSTAAATMMMVTAKTEQHCIIKGYSQEMVDIGVEPSDTIDTVQRRVDTIPVGNTDCAKPMIDAMENKIKDVDVFVVYTDNETWYGKCHPFYALQEYRQYSERPNAKLIVCGMCSTEFTIADPSDQHMLDVIGFDSSAPAIISDFALDRI